MKQSIVNYNTDFRVLTGNARSQAAVMVLKAGEATGGPENKHPDSDQWLFVVSGEGQAIVAGQQMDLKAGSLLLIEKGEGHEIRNTGDAPLETINFYVPPEY